MINLILRLFFVHIVYPIIIEFFNKREKNDEFKKESDEIYSNLNNAKTSAERKEAARKLYELQKKF